MENDTVKTTTQTDVEREANLRAEERRAYERNRAGGDPNYLNAGSGRLGDPSYDENRKVAARDPNVARVTVGEAARRLRDSGLLDDANPMTPEDRHRANFSGRVCAALGLESTAENITRVVDTMQELGIVPHDGHEYPKWIKTGKKVQVYDTTTDGWIDGKKDEEVIVHDEDDEAAVGRGEEPRARVVTSQNAPSVRTDQPLFGLRSIPPTPVDDRVPSSLGADGAKAASGTFDEGRGPPLPPGSPNTGGRFLTEDSPDRGLPGFPNAGTGRNESAGYAQTVVETEGVARSGAPVNPGGRTNEPGYSGRDEISAPHAGPEGYLDTGSRGFDTARSRGDAGAERLGEPNHSRGVQAQTTAEKQIEEQRVLDEKRHDPQPVKPAPQPPKAPQRRS